jgi:lysozyme family protein
MTNFEIAVNETIDTWEHGYQCDSKDTGNWTGGKLGVGDLKGTNWGISASSYPALDIKNLTREQAVEIYHQDFWNPLYDQLTSQDVAKKVFDLGVNEGKAHGVKLLQLAIRACCVGPVVVDGVFGSGTLKAANACEPARLLREMRAAACYFYHRSVVQNPADEIYIQGWLRRASA